MTLLVSLKDKLARDLRSVTLSDAFRQVENWANALIPAPYGASGTVLTSTPGTLTGLSWSTPVSSIVSSRVHRAGAWTTGAGGIYVQFNFDTTDYGTQVPGVALTLGGRYLVTSKVRASAPNASETLGIGAFVGGVLYAAGAWNVAPAPGGGYNLDAAMSTVVKVTAGQSILIFAICSTPGLTGAVGSTDVYCTLDYIGP